MSVTKNLPTFFATFSDKKQRERYRARIERIRREQGLQEHYQTVTREEKDLTVKAIVLTQLHGHWFKCPNGGCNFKIRLSVQVRLKINAFDANFLWKNLDSNLF